MRNSVLILATVLILALPALGKNEKVQVRILDQKESSQEFVVSYPGYQQSNCGAYGYGNQAQVNCSSVFTPAGHGEYRTQGYVMTFLLPDKRIVIVTCEKKTNWTEFSTNWYRSCRRPLTGEVEAEFNGDKAKLSWAVSLDGTKKNSETYKIVAVLSPTEAEK